MDGSSATRMMPRTSAADAPAPEVMLPLAKRKPERVRSLPLVIYDPGKLRSPATTPLLMPYEAHMPRVYSHSKPESCSERPLCHARVVFPLRSKCAQSASARAGSVAGTGTTGRTSPSSVIAEVLVPSASAKGPQDGHSTSNCCDKAQGNHCQDECTSRDIYL